MKKIKLLQSVALFWDLKKEELGYISEKMVSRKYESGNYIFMEESFLTTVKGPLKRRRNLLC